MSKEPMIIEITSTNGNLVYLGGSLVDENTRCRHYHSSLDIIAIKFKCCGVYYPCFECHKDGTSCSSTQKSDIEEPKLVENGISKNIAEFDFSNIYEYLSRIQHLPVQQHAGKQKDQTLIINTSSVTWKKHSLERWKSTELKKELVILCGSCYHELTFDQYTSNNATCPFCQGSFNPKCSLHYDLYFDFDSFGN